jgi:hypothetical protein
MTARQRLPNRRPCESFELEIAGLRYVVSVGRYADGRVGELFITNHKSGSSADTNARDAAITCSIALQFGADIQILRKALCRDSQGRPSGPLAAALDLIAEESAS